MEFRWPNQGTWGSGIGEVPNGVGAIEDRERGGGDQFQPCGGEMSFLGTRERVSL